MTPFKRFRVKDFPAYKLTEEQKEAEEEGWPIPEYLAVPSQDFDQEY